MKQPTPEYVPLPKGRDEGTQIEKWELLDYDNEVEPVLQVLVGRTLSQSRIELIENWEKEEKLKRLVSEIPEDSHE